LIRLVTVLLLLFCSVVSAEENQAPLMTPLELLYRFGATEVFEYSCPANTQCQVRCSAGESQERFEYGNVKRFEMSRSPGTRILVVVFMDPVGKGHRATGILPNPTSCILNDLIMQRVSPLSDGELLRPAEDDEVIFEFRAQ
jgi:hypothetical protein